MGLQEISFALISVFLIPSMYLLSLLFFLILIYRNYYGIGGYLDYPRTLAIKTIISEYSVSLFPF